jgi:hypothetical protein
VSESLSILVFLNDMQDLEPHFRWRDLYRSEDDSRSPFYEREYSEFEYTNQIYNYLLHPQWDEFGSPTLYIKILYADYHDGYAIIEMIGEWNDAVTNDIMYLKRDVIEVLLENGINKFILVGENVLNYHASDDSYYEEWFQEVEDGWIVALNFQEHVLQEFRNANLDYYINFGGDLDSMIWRKYSPMQVFSQIQQTIQRRLG